MEEPGKDRVSLKGHGWIGLFLIGISEILLYLGVYWVGVYFTPLVWTGYILWVDSLVYRRKGASLILTRPRELAVMLPLSIGFWLIFEFYNLFLRNWHYVGLPGELPLRFLGYVWAFATIWPAILETAEALEGWSWLSNRRTKPLGATPRRLLVSLSLGGVCSILPFLTSAGVAHYLAAPVWLGFIFFLDPINYWLGNPSLFRDLERGNPRTLYCLLLSGILCGFLWEFWNYWAGARWVYTVPILGHVKIFEMPILGYLGFPLFAVEGYVMYALFRSIFYPPAKF